MTELSNSWADLYSPCNRTELYQICRRKGLEVLPGISRDDMIEYILGTKEPPGADHPIDAWRRGIMAVIIDHRAVVQATLSCPAKTMDPDACFQCPDTQVISCLVQNPNDEPLIATRRLLRPRSIGTTPMADESLTIANAPRNREELLSRGAFRLSKLGNQLAAEINPRTGAPYMPSMSDAAPASKALWQAVTSGKPALVVDALLPLLLLWDDAKAGGVAAPPAAAMAAPAVSAAPATTVVLPTGPGPVTETKTRTPRTPATSASNGDISELAKAIENNNAAINALAVTVTRLSSTLEAQGEMVDGINRMVAGVVQAAVRSLGINMLLGNAVLQAGYDEVAESANELIPRLPALFGDAQGKVG